MAFWIDTLRLSTLELLWDLPTELPNLYAAHKRFEPLLTDLAPMFGLITEDVIEQYGFLCKTGIRVPTTPGTSTNYVPKGYVAQLKTSATGRWTGRSGV